MLFFSKEFHFFKKAKKIKNLRNINTQNMASDIAKEIMLINSFVTGWNSGRSNIFSIKHPICYQCRARSSWFSAYHSSMLIMSGASLNMALFVPSLIALTSFLFIFFMISFLLSESKFLPFVSLFMILTMGGFGFMSWFSAKGRRDMNADYVYNNGFSNSCWLHPILLYLIPHRNIPFILYSFSSILAIFIKMKKPSPNEYIAIGILAAFTAPMQHQGFFSILIYLISYFAILFFNERNNRNLMKVIWKSLQKMIIAFVVVVFIPLMNYRKTGMDLSWIRFELLWNEQIQNGYYFPLLVLWFQNLGFYPFLALFVLWFFLEKKQLLLYLATLPGFIIGNIILFQQINYHSIFFFYTTWILFGCILVPIALKKISFSFKNEETQGVFLALSIIFISTTSASSLLGLKKQWNYDQKIWYEAEEKVADFIIKNTKKSDIFLAPDSIFNPVTTLAGRTSFKTHPRTNLEMNYIWFYYRDEVAKLVKNPESDILPMITYILQHDRQHYEEHLNKTAIGENGPWKLVFAYESYQLFKRVPSH
ncbi:hypothetical protein TRFO_33798 [Tritrichomonas foetus]|uniref:Uncharacterized protein n=1 Tax=Tritrichomonas foetus TaxID=1144522 RepID=A0A1J4JKV8_9EUKA|nr:hypothetical protein TRFO_33798 [Tritrichomonas foetus]|eukprot:OHS99722.1 hypothetical protein TRFO_33798 [Tritrichomonas foetus]